MCGCFDHNSVCHMHARCQQRPEEGSESPVGAGHEPSPLSARAATLNHVSIPTFLFLLRNRVFLEKQSSRLSLAQGSSGNLRRSGQVPLGGQNPAVVIGNTELGG